MLTPNEKYQVFRKISTLMAQQSSVDTRDLARKTLAELHQISELNYHHIFGYISFLKRCGHRIEVIEPGRKSVIYK